MLRKILTGITGLILTVAVVTAGTGTVFANDPFSNNDGSVNACDAPNPNVKNSALCSGKSNATKNPLTGPNGLLSKVTLILAVVSGIAAVIIILVGSFMYVTSGGDAGKIGEAKKVILYAVVGLVVIVVGQSLILFILSQI